jgi:hypothetical protein
MQPETTGAGGGQSGHPSKPIGGMDLSGTPRIINDPALPPGR